MNKEKEIKRDIKHTLDTGEYEGVQVRKIRNFRGYYVTENGKVYSVRKRGVPIEIAYETIVSSNGLSYKSVQLRRGCLVFRKYVHRLVYETFNEVILSSRQKVFFKDYNWENCSVDNLSTHRPDYVLGKGEVWLVGYEGLYFVLRDDVYSVVNRDEPKKLLPSKAYGGKAYFLHDSEGKRELFRLKMPTNKRKQEK